MKRLALRIADLLLAYVARGDHSGGYRDRVSDIRAELNEFRWLFYRRRGEANWILSSVRRRGAVT